MLFKLCGEVRDPSVLDLTRLGEIPLALSCEKFVFKSLDLFVDLLGLSYLFFFFLPAGFESGGCLLRSRQFFLELLKSLLARGILLLAEGLLLHFEHHDLPFHLVDLGRHRLDLDLQP